MKRSIGILFLAFCGLFLPIPTWAQSDATGTSASPAETQVTLPPAGTASPGVQQAASGAASTTAAPSRKIEIEGIIETEELSKDPKYGKKVEELQGKTVCGFSGEDLVGFLTEMVQKVVLKGSDGQTYALTFKNNKVNRQVAQMNGTRIRIKGTLVPPATEGGHPQIRVKHWEEAGK